LLKEYEKFVDGVTSDTSKNTDLLIERIKELQTHNIDVARLLTGAMGSAGEAGEFIDIVKKILFHGKPYTEEIHDKLKSECSDQIWYWITNVIALGEDPEDIIRYNIKKLESRYPGGKFSIERSEIRINELDEIPLSAVEKDHFKKLGVKPPAKKVVKKDRGTAADTEFKSRTEFDKMMGDPRPKRIPNEWEKIPYDSNTDPEIIAKEADKSMKSVKNLWGLFGQK